ncbi:MAG: multiheme c-type cytochrome, partial [Dehalococcoidia bacterium]|nr:multiheme c-type cytochrome [Dehalococcoidia bacterium]
MKKTFEISCRQRAKKHPILFLLLALSVMVPALLRAEEEPFIRMPDKPAYMGAAACNGRCHDPWYRAWKDTPHAKTYELLKPGVRANAKTMAGINPD